MKYILERLAEKSTWAGLGAILAGVGYAVRPDLWESIVALGVAVAGVGLALTKDRKPE